MNHKPLIDFNFMPKMGLRITGVLAGIILLMADAPARAGDRSPFDEVGRRAWQFVTEGVSHLKASRKEDAIAAFDQATDEFLNAPDEVALDPRYQPAFRALVEQVHILEIQGPSAVTLEFDEWMRKSALAGETASADTPRQTKPALPVPAPTLAPPSPAVPPIEQPAVDAEAPAEDEADDAATEATGDPRQNAAQNPATPPGTTSTETPAPQQPVGVEFLQQVQTEAATAVAPADIKTTSAAALGTQSSDLPIELNDQVYSAISVYSGKFRNWFSAALSRGQPFIPRIREIFAGYGVPQDLSYLPIVESAFNSTATSRARARGMWQFMAETGKLYGLKQDHFVDERADFEKATHAAAQYLSKLYAMFGDWNLALTAYNAGEGRVQRAIKRTGTSDFWELREGRTFRNETKSYVPLIHAAIIMAKSPETYGIEVSTPEEIIADTLDTRGSYPLSVVARCAGTSASTIKSLNPQLRRSLTPSSLFTLRVPAGRAGETESCLSSEARVSYRFHTVARGETAGSIAKRYGVSTAALLSANNLSTKSRLRRSMELLIPSGNGTRAAKTSKGSSTQTASTTRSHRIQPGDTLYDLANRYGTSVEALKALNGLRSSKLSIGQVIVIADTEGN